MHQLRLITFVALTFSFSFYLTGLFWWIFSVPQMLILVFIFTSLSFDQLPEERLYKFANMFGTMEEENSEEIGDHGDHTDEDVGLVPLHRIVLHRAGNLNAPENTLPAIQEAAKQGVAGVEIDLQFTLDGVGIVLHDDTLDRTTDSTGDVRYKCFAELEGVNAAAKHKYGIGREAVKIPTLEECLKLCLDLNLLIFIDCKASPLKTADLVDELFTKYPDLYDSAVICSFSPSIIYTMRKTNPRVITALTYRKLSMSCEADCVTPRFFGLKQCLYTCLDYMNTWFIYSFAWHFCGNSYLLLNKESLCRNEVNWWKDLGIRLMVWTVNSNTEKAYFLDHLQVPIITDSL